ncbi:hypothetical protein IV498_14675 [Paenarthrobacter sp. Z7-10]|uniref:hypothetical protein n=1 Tax=Paenarthrobacter sp. Z7-10 TaxID=2787635 RepID=UPI0022A99B5A|nr:hypothetical protein [Paenarthrobacter sp. Z7-10]MCZ2404387.1 hypothetical protein [Paenarthrobacter sp. Z7-10]
MLLSNALYWSGTVIAQVPNPGTGEAPPGSAGILTILKWVAWIVFALAVVGILACAGTMMVSNRRGEGGEHAGRLAWVLGGCILASVSSALVGALV